MSSKRIRAINRREFLKTSAAIGGGLTLSSILASCEKATPVATTAPTEGPVNIKAYLMSGSIVDYWSAVQTAWNEGSHPFKVNLDITPEENEAWKTAHRTVLAGNDPPDMNFIFPGQGWAPYLADAELIMDLTPYAEKYGWLERYDPLFAQDLYYKGQFLSIAQNNQPHAYVFYNKTIFEDLGIEIPENRQPSLDQFATYIEKSKSAGYEPIALGNKDRWPGGHFWSMMVNRVMEHDYITKLRWAFREATDAKWTDPLPLESMNLVKDWVEKGYFATGLNAMGDGEAQALFVSGKATMYQSGFWAVNNLKQAAPDMAFDFFHYPAIKSNIPIAIIAVPGCGIVIAKNSKVADAVAALCDFAITVEGQKLMVEKVGMFPGTNEMVGVDLAWPHPLLGVIYNDLVTIKWEPFQFENDMPGELKEEGMVALQGVFAGTVTPEEMAEKIQTVVDKMIAEV
jgi:raffinose/stachyose/melibiose transport system substrate-binding protein